MKFGQELGSVLGPGKVGLRAVERNPVVFILVDLGLWTLTEITSLKSTLTTTLRSL